MPRSCDVVVVNYNAGVLLEDCVNSVLAQGASRLVLVDNASHDDSLERVATRFGADERLIILRNPTNTGFAAACNLGARHCEQQHILFLNPDTVLQPGALQGMVDALCQADDLGMAGGLLCNFDGSEQPGGTPGLSHATTSAGTRPQPVGPGTTVATTVFRLPSAPRAPAPPSDTRGSHFRRLHADQAQSPGQRWRLGRRLFPALRGPGPVHALSSARLEGLLRTPGKDLPYLGCLQPLTSAVCRMAQAPGDDSFLWQVLSR